MTGPPGKDWTGLHASAAIVGESTVLIRGPSGSGKSALALALLTQAREARAFAALVGDDRVWLSRAGGRLLAAGATALAGVAERRGVGLVVTDAESRGIVGLVVDLAPPGARWPRLPEPTAERVRLLEVSLPRLALDFEPGIEDRVRTVIDRLTKMTADKCHGITNFA